MDEKDKVCECEKPAARHVGCHPTSCIICGWVIE